MILQAIYRNRKLLVLASREEEVHELVKKLRELGLKVEVKAVSLCG